MIRTSTIRMTTFDPIRMLAANFGTLSTWHQRFRQRLALASLEPRMQRDVGLTPGKAAIEAAKPFWLA